MRYENKLCYRVYGRNALFTDPVSKTGGEKTSLFIPTPQALIGITESLYWKPTIKYYIDRFRLIKPILTETKGIRPIKYGGGNDLSYVTYLCDVEYEVEFHFEWNMNNESLAQDRNENKHYYILKRSIEKGGRRDVFLGTRECAAYVEPCVFGEKQGYYDHYGKMDFGLQFHSFSYPDENNENKLYARFWNPVMNGGVVEVCRPEQCEMFREIRNMNKKTFTLGENVLPIDQEQENMLHGEGVHGISK